MNLNLASYNVSLTFVLAHNVRLKPLHLKLLFLTPQFFRSMGSVIHPTNEKGWP